MCTGDCDSDADCASGLKCFQRPGKGAVPGCTSGGSGDKYDFDYCHSGLDYGKIFTANCPKTCNTQTMRSELCTCTACHSVPGAPCQPHCACTACSKSCGVGKYKVKGSCTGNSDYTCKECTTACPTKSGDFLGPVCDGTGFTDTRKCRSMDLKTSSHRVWIGLDHSAPADTCFEVTLEA